MPYSKTTCYLPKSWAGTGVASVPETQRTAGILEQDSQKYVGQATQELVQRPNTNF